MDLEFNLESDIGNNKEIISLLLDREMACDFYRALCNMRWKKIENYSEEDRLVDTLKGVDPTVWHCSWRHAGGIIADIRNLNYNTSEGYMDFYCSGGEGRVSEKVNECFNKMGWTQYPWRDDDV